MRPTLLLLLLGACVTDEAAKTGPVEVEGLVRQRDARCGGRGDFVLAVGSKPVAGRRFSIRAADAAGVELASIVTSDEGAFRVALRPGRWCFVDTTDVAAATGCAGVLSYDPSSEPIPVVVLAPLPCP